MRILDEKFERAVKDGLKSKIETLNIYKSQKEQLKENIENINEKLLLSFVSEASDSKVSSRSELRQLAMTMAKKAFGKDKVDEKKIDGMVDNAIKDATDEDGKTTDWEKASGIIVGSFNS